MQNQIAIQAKPAAFGGAGFISSRELFGQVSTGQFHGGICGVSQGKYNVIFARNFRKNPRTLKRIFQSIGKKILQCAKKMTTVCANHHGNIRPANDKCQIIRAKVKLAGGLADYFRQVNFFDVVGTRRT